MAGKTRPVFKFIPLVIDTLIYIGIVCLRADMRGNVEFQVVLDAVDVCLGDILYFPGGAGGIIFHPVD